jgi:thiol-disulfide isomerase/thioredoxin
MKEIWDIINKMKKKSYLIFLFTIILLSCSDSNNSIMNQVDVKTPAVFNLPDLDGKYINATDLKGSYVLVNFWATWCKPCVRELPSLNNLHKIFEDSNNFKLVAINVGQSKKVINEFINNKSPIDFMVLVDEQIELTDWEVSAIPTTYLVDDKGTIIYKVEGEREWDSEEFTSFIKSFIK